MFGREKGDPPQLAAGHFSILLSYLYAVQRKFFLYAGTVKW